MALESKCGSDVRNMVAWRIPLKLTTNWTIIIQQRILYTTQKRLRDLRIKTSEGGQIGVNRGGGNGEVERQGPWDAARSSLQSWEKRELRLNVHSLCPSTPAWGLSMQYAWTQWSKQRPWGKDWIQKGDNCGLTALTARQKKKPQNLAASPNPPRACLPHTLLVLAVGPRKKQINKQKQ